MGSGGDARGEWDFFVSYAQADRAWAEWIAWTLEEDGYRVLIQAWDFVPGSNWVQKMQDGVREAHRTVAVLSAEYLQSVYGGAEWQAAWVRDPAGADRRLLPVRVSPCDWAGLLAGVTGIDLVGLGEAAATGRLRAQVEAAVRGRAKPEDRPGFPGSGGSGGGRAVPRARFPGEMPRVWKVPAQNPHFTGRAGELAGLAAGLAAGPRLTVQSVHGMGGVGKTQLAGEYAYAHAADYDVVWWITADEPALIADQFAALAAGLGLEPDSDPDAIRAAVHEALRTAGNWLLIFDNADTVTGIRGWLPGGPVPAEVRGHVIITTRRGGFGSLGTVLDLDVIGTGDAVALLRTRVADLDQQTGELIAEELERLPLALEQAAAYLDQTQLPPEEYLDLLQARTAEMHARGRAGDRQDTIATLWDLSLEQISHQDLAAVQLLDICACLAPRPIPLDLFTDHPDLLPEPLSAVATDLNNLALIMQDLGLAEQARPLAERALAIDEATLGPDHPHVATDLNNLALIMQDLELAEQARPLAERALAITETALGPGHPTVATRLNNLALIMRGDLGLPEQARPLAERALAIDEAVLGPDHPNVAICLRSLARIMQDLGLEQEAQRLRERADSVGKRAGSSRTGATGETRP